MEVTKRNGRRAPLDMSKIHRSVEWACEGLNVSLSDIEVGSHIQLFNGIKTKDIHSAMINSAASLVDIDTPDYEFAAARLLLQQIYKEINDGDISYQHIANYIKRGVDEGRLTPEMLSVFDLDKLNEAIDPSRDFQFKHLGLKTIYDRYLIRETPKNGALEGGIIEMPQHFWMRVAMGIALKESEPTIWAIEFYNVLSKFEFVNSTPTLFNSGTLHPQMSSCYVTTVDDSIFEPTEDSVLGKGIFSTMTECALYSKFSGGVGSDWNRVRPTGGHIKTTNGMSSGVVPYLKVFNDTSVAVNQCHAPDTLVYTPNGAKRIDDMKIGDFVLGHSGKYREVLDVMKYEQGEAPMVSINVKHSSEPMVITSGHPIFSIKNVPMEQSVSRTMSQIESGKLKTEWVEAGSLVVGDYVAQIVPKETIAVPGFTEDDAHIYGIMLGDGHCSKKVATSGVNTKEWGVTGMPNEATIVFVKKYLSERNINFYEVSRKGNEAIQIKWSYGGKKLERKQNGTFDKSEACMPFDYEDLYNDNHEKRISTRFNALPESQTIALIQGLIESDGNISKGKEITFCNTSKELIEGIRYQCLRLGIPTSANKRVRSLSHLNGDGEFSTSWDVRIPSVEKLAKAVGSSVVTKQNWLQIGDNIFSRVKSSESIKPVEYVYDLIVDIDETYMTNSALVHNGGRRAGSFAVYLEPWHGDIERFIDLKKPNGDERLRARELFPVLWLNDLFMERVRENGQWSLFNPVDVPQLHELYGDEFEAEYKKAEAEGKAIRTIDADKLWRKAISALVESGNPWLCFKDEFNRRNPQSHVGVIHSSNLCLEIGLNTDDSESAVCNLGSINLAVIGPEAFKRVVPVAMRMLDNVIDLNFYPTDKSRRANMRHRPVGLGVMGWYDYIISRGIDFESNEHLKVTNDVFERLSYWAIRSSMELATERGAYESFEGSKWSKGKLPIDTARMLPKAWVGSPLESTVEWEPLRKAVMKNGMRNSNCLAIAPTATIANIVGVEACIEPPFKLVTIPDNKSGKFKIVAPSLRRGHPELCKSAFDMDQTWIIKAAAVRQQYVCQSQSVNLFKRQEIKGNQLSEWYFLAWQLGLKSTYYLKQQIIELGHESAGSGSSEPAFCSMEPGCESCQ